MCEFHGSNGNGFGDIWWTDNPIYFSSIDLSADMVLIKLRNPMGGMSNFQKKSVTNVMWEWVGVKFSGKNRCVSLEWPHT